MTQKDKQLLLKDLCGRLPYGVMVENVLNHEVFDLSKYLHCLPAALENFKPYLRPMSSMTKDEYQEYDEFEFISASHFAHGIEAGELTDWLNAHHFDFHRLIEKGLALEAPEGMYE